MEKKTLPSKSLLVIQDMMYSIVPKISNSGLQFFLIEKLVY